MTVEKIQKFYSMSEIEECRYGFSACIRIRTGSSPGATLRPFSSCSKIILKPICLSSSISSDLLNEIFLNVVFFNTADLKFTVRIVDSACL